MVVKKRIRVIKKVVEDGAKRFVSLRQEGGRWVWDARPGVYFLEWWEGAQRRRESVGVTPSQVIAASRRKQAELLGALIEAGRDIPLSVSQRRLQSVEAPQSEPEHKGMRVTQARELWLEHVRTHSPDKPETERRYRQVLDHFERILQGVDSVEDITRAHIDEYKSARMKEKSERTGRPLTPGTVNFEVSTLRTFFYYLSRERGLKLENPCKKFKKLRDARRQRRQRPPVYTQDEIDKLFAECDDIERTAFATLLLTGLRKRELYYLTWRDIDFRKGVLTVTGDGKVGFSPKDYETRLIPMPPELMPPELMPPELIEILKGMSRDAEWVFTNRNGRRLNHLLRRLKTTADRAGVTDATLHKFRHTYCTRLVENGTDIVTVQKLAGHSDIETTMCYLLLICE